MRLPDAVKTAALLFGEGASLGMLAWALSTGGLVQYASENRLPMSDRRQLLLVMVLGGLAMTAGGIIFLLRARREPAVRLSQGAVRLSPLLLAGLLPLLFNWRLWAARELTFGVLCCIVGFTLRASLEASLKAGAGFAEEGPARALARLWTRVAARAAKVAPPLIVASGALFYAIYFSYYTIAYHRSVLTMSFDLGLEDNLLWNLVHGGPFMKSSPPFGPVGSHFGFHATLFAYVIGAFYYFHQRPETLLVFQAVMLGAAAIPLYLFTARRLGRWVACAVAVMYLLYPPLHGSNLYDFHYLPLGVFFLWLTLFLVEAGHYKTAAIAVLLTLSVREDVAADLAIIGAFLILQSRRPRAGAVVAAVAGVYFLVIKMVVMPRFLSGGESFINQWQELVPQGGRGYAGVLMTVFGNPVYTLTGLLEASKFLYLVQIGAPFCFFAWRRPIGFLLSLPGFFFTILGTKYLPLVQISFQYTAHWTAFLFPAFVVALQWSQQPQFPGDPWGVTRKRAWLATAFFMTVLTSYQYGAILQQNTARGGFVPYKFRTTEQDRARYRNLMSLVNRVPPLAKISSSEFVVPHVSSRPDSYTIRQGLFDAEYLLFELPLRDDERPAVKDALKSRFGVVATAGEFVLARRSHGTAENSRVLKRIR